MHLIQTTNPMHLVLFYGEMQIFREVVRLRNPWGSRMERNKNNGNWIKKIFEKGIR